MLTGYTPKLAIVFIVLVIMFIILVISNLLLLLNNDCKEMK